MARGNLAVVFGALVAGAVVIDYGVKSARGAITSPSSATGASASPGVTSTTPVSVSGFPSAVNPLPGAAGTRLDQGMDATGNTFLAPWTGTVVRAVQNDPGWGGGGYVAVQSNTDASRVYYLAEGILPTVREGDSVVAGQKIATPIRNPYNGIMGNIEAGLANPASPGQPLAQVTGNAAAMVKSFAAWLASLGGPTPTSTGNAGAA